MSRALTKLDLWIASLGVSITTIGLNRLIKREPFQGRWEWVAQFVGDSRSIIGAFEIDSETLKK